MSKSSKSTGKKTNEKKLETTKLIETEESVDKSWINKDEPETDVHKFNMDLPADSVANFDYEKALELGTKPIQDLDIGQRLRYMIAKSKQELNPAVQFSLIKLLRQLHGEKLYQKKPFHGREGNRFGKKKQHYHHNE